MIYSSLLKQLVFGITLFVFIGCGGDSGNIEPEIEPTLTTITTFSKTHLNFGNGGKQSAQGTFNFLGNNDRIEEILMFVKLECPQGGCGAWDVFANINVKDPASGSWYELGRFITPYGVDNSKIESGFIFDVTDFKSILQGSVQLKAFIEVWTIEGWLLTVDFKIKEGNPKYKYSAIVSLLNFANNSQQIPYGEPLPFDISMVGKVTIPEKVAKTKLRTIITGWGHATPNDNGGRGCAEWCFRTHTIFIGGANFRHSLNAIGCDSNPVNPQNGNWQPDRAGWCPGKEVPFRIDEFSTPRTGETLNFEYKLEDWVNNNGNGKAYYSISTFIIVESDMPIQKPLVE